MSAKTMLSILAGSIVGALLLDATIGAGGKQAVQRCPCVDPSPDKANIDPARFAGQFGLHVCAFHVGKEDPTLQVESHHYCTPLRDGVFQCTIYDSDRGNAKLIGVEYIVSEEIYKTLPAQEKTYWHPHDFEIRAGLLTFTGIQPDCEKKLLKGLLKTWGKVWHTWPDPKTDLPIGPPVLMWSATQKEPVRPELVKARDRRYQIDAEQIRKQRAKLFEAEK